MPAFCSVLKCSMRAERDKVSFFRFPAVLTNRGDYLNAVTSDRRNAWIRSLKRGPLTETQLKNGRVCSRHFISGKPASLEDKNNPDWIPNQNMGYLSGARKTVSDLTRYKRTMKRAQHHDHEREVNTGNSEETVDHIGTSVPGCSYNFSATEENISSSEIHGDSVGVSVQTLDPLETGESGEVESKLILNEIRIKGQALDSDEEDNVDHLSPQTLLETPEEHEVQYSIRSPGVSGNMITYRVLQVDDNGVETVPQLVTGSTGYSNATGVPQVLTSNLNGPLYVIGNANEVFASAPAGTRAIAPRTSLVETNNTVVTNIKKRDERRRATHIEVERRRRDKINNWITKLATIIPENTSSEMRANGHFDGQSKGGILAKACDYIMDLGGTEAKHEVVTRELIQKEQELEAQKAKNSILERENRELKAILKKNGILYSHSP